MTPVERKRVLFDWNQTDAAFPEACLHELVEATARSFPTAPAILCNGELVRYDELMRRAHRLASDLHQRGVGEGSIVALYLPRSPSLIVAQLAVLETGAAYLALDRSYPLERNRFALADARPALVITLDAMAGDLDSSHHALLLDDAATPRGDQSQHPLSRGRELPTLSGFEPGEKDERCVRSPREGADVGQDGVSSCRPESTAYVTYTSGSTGRPKGVVIDHRGPVNYIAHLVATRKLLPHERVLQFTSFSFDASVRDTLGTLAFGGTIILLDDEGARDPLSLLAAIRDHRATVILSIVPTMLRALVRAALEKGFAGGALRLIMVSGEALLRSDVEGARRAFAGVQIVNQYGATECSMVSSDYPVPAELPLGPASLPVGRPIAHTRIYILDPDLEPMPPGAEGDVWIGGVGVGPGYLNNPELTAQRFLPDPYSVSRGGRMYRTGDLGRRLPDGTIQYLGRRDQQVKIRGYRVELGEIECVLREHPAVREAAVLLAAPSGQELITAYVTLNREAHAGELRSFLARRLPFSMLPASFVVLDGLPLTPNGKVDRESLPAPRRQRMARPYLPARSPVEARLVSLWESVLGVENIDVSDDFFELGGHSLMAVRLFARIETEFGRTLPLTVLFENGSVESLARMLEKDGPPSSVVALQPQGAKSPLFLIPAYLYVREFALCFAPDRPVHGLHAETPFARPIEEEALVHYENLVAFQPTGPYLLLGHSAGGYIALEIARLLMQSGKEVQFLGLLDTFPPGRRRQATPMERLRLHLENLRGRNAAEALAYLSQSVKRSTLRGLRYVPGSHRLAASFAGAEQWLERLMVQNYVPKPFPGNVTLFVVGERPEYVRWDPMQTWRRYLTGHVEVVPISGGHMSAIKPPRASVLARKIDDMCP